jgi:branched-chain amino acid transport system substrate-binding protein
MLKAVGGTAAAAALAGCTSLVGNNGDEGSGTDAQEELSDEPLDVMLLTFTKGAAGVLGIQAQRGAELAVQRINDAGGIGGSREVNLTVKDEASDAISKYRASIDEGADATFGPISSGTYEALAPEIESQEVVNVSTDGTVTTLFEETVPDPQYAFRFQNYDASRPFRRT